MIRGLDGVCWSARRDVLERVRFSAILHRLDHQAAAMVATFHGKGEAKQERTGDAGPVAEADVLGETSAEADAIHRVSTGAFPA